LKFKMVPFGKCQAPLLVLLAAQLQGVLGVQCPPPGLFVKQNEPACCDLESSPAFAMLANRTSNTELSIDSIMEQLSSLAPAGAILGVHSVAQRPLFEKFPKIWLKIVVRRVYDVNQKSQTYKLQADLLWTWRDCRLMYNPSGVKGMLGVADSSSLFSKFWKPDVSFTEEVAGGASADSRSLLLSPDGLVILRHTITRSLSCDFDFSELPFDIQACTFTISVPQFVSEKLTLEWDPKPLEVPDLKSKQWTFSDEADWLANLAVTNYSSSLPGPERSISALSVSFSMARKAHDYILDFVLPAVVYWLCSYGGFWVDPGAVPGRVALGLIPILTLNNKMGQLRNVLPPVNERFRLESFMLAMLMLIILQLSEYCLLNYATRVVKEAKQNNDKDAKPPAAAVMEVGCAEQVIVVAPVAGQKEHSEIKSSSGRRRSMWYTYERIKLRWALWAQPSLDFHSRWVFMLVAVITVICTLFA